MVESEGVFVTLAEIEEFIGETISTDTTKKYHIDSARIAIKEVEADLKGLLNALGITVSTTESDNPESFKGGQMVVKNGSAAQILHGMRPTMDANGFAVVNSHREEWIRMRDELRKSPRILFDSTFGNPGNFGPNSGADQRGWTSSNVDDSVVVRRFKQADKY